MKNQIKNKNLVYPWHVKGYIKLDNKIKNRIIKFFINRTRFKSDINRILDVPDYWIHNFIRHEKIDTNTFKKIVDLMGDKNLIKGIVQFNDDKGGSSVPFKGEFPIHYNPIWHFIFCLSIGDGHIKKGIKKQFYWYQKPEGMKKLIKLINNMDFCYSPKISICKYGVCIPQLIRKIGNNITGLETGENIKNGIVESSTKLGREYELALLMAFFLDESGMSKSTKSEITLHQEGNLILLQDIERLLNKFGVTHSRNKKGEGWVIRLKVQGIIKLSKLFNSLNSYGIDLFHRQDIFNQKVKIAKLSLGGQK